MVTCGVPALPGLSWPLPEGLDDDGLDLLLFPAPMAASQSDRRPIPDWIYVEKELRRRSVTRLLLWEEYRAANPDGFGYTADSDEVGHAFQSEAGHYSELMPARDSDAKPATWSIARAGLLG